MIAAGPAPRVLVTRPRDDARELALALAEAGIASLIEPMMTIEPVDGPAPELAGVQAVLATSANGVRALARTSLRRDIPLLAVGDATARAAASAGFRDVASAAGDVEALAALAIERLRPEVGALLHVAGGEVAGDLAGDLAAAGFSVRRAVLYRARATAALSADAAAALGAGALAGALFFSPRTARIFVDLATVAELAHAFRPMTAFCVSAAASQAAAALPWRARVVAARPTQAQLLAAVVAALGQSGGA